MSKKINRLFTLALALIFLTGLAPRSQAQIKVIDEKTVRVTGSGMAEKGRQKKREQRARDAAMANAIEQVVNSIIRDQVERDAYEQVKDEFLSNYLQYVIDYKFKRKNTNNKMTNVLLEVVVNKDLIQQNLINLGVISAAKDVRKELDRFTIMPYLDTGGSSAEALKYKELFYTRVRVFFEDQGISTIGQDEVMAVEADEEMLAKLKSSTAEEGEEDPALQIARNTPADIFVKITTQIETGKYGGATTKKVILTIGAYMVMTGEFIGSGDGFSEPLALSSDGASVAAGIDQAMNNAMGKVMDRIQSFWRDFVKEGRPIKIILTDFGFSEVGQLRNWLQETANDQKRLKAAGNVSEYMVWFDGSAEDLMYELYEYFMDQSIPLKEDPSMISNTIRFFREK